MTHSAFDFRPGTVAVVVLSMCMMVVVHAADPSSVEDSARQIVQRALPEVIAGGDRWIRDKDCLSCHRVSFTAWSLNRADALGVNVDQERLSSINAWTTDWKNMVNPKRRAETEVEAALTGESDTVAQVLLGRPVAKDGDEPNWVSLYRDSLLKAQLEDGSWAAAGQLPLQKRPKRETQEVTTAWVIVALAATPGGDVVREASVKKAMAWLGADSHGESTEWWATRLLVERQLGNTAQADRLRETLLGFQREDGGWGWLTADKSDALGTGIAIYALARDGASMEDSAIKNAVRFLSETQNDDGSFSVNGTKTARRNSVTETASYWGTCWAVIGLMELPH